MITALQAYWIDNGRKYPAAYHNAINALISGDARLARPKLAHLLRSMRRDGRRPAAREMLSHATFIGYPLKREWFECSGY